MTVHLRLHVEGRGMVAKTYPEAFQFPGGEWHLRNLPQLDKDCEGEVTYVADVRGADVNDLIKAHLWADVARSEGHQFVLMQPYLPAARADRGAPLGASVYASHLRALEADQIITLDPHSSFMPRLFRNLQIAEHDSLIAQAFDGVKLDGIICPDEGAKDRARSAGLYMDLPVHYGTKKRDFETGKLGSFEAPEGLSSDGTYLVVDDICDGGGTFKGLASVLGSEYGITREQLALWTTHGIYSGKADELRSYYRWIATTDSHPGSRRVEIATCIVPCFQTMYDYI